MWQSCIEINLLHFSIASAHLKRRTADLLLRVRIICNLQKIICGLIRYSYIYEAHMSHAINKSNSRALQTWQL